MIDLYYPCASGWSCLGFSTTNVPVNDGNGLQISIILLQNIHSPHIGTDRRHI